MSLQHNLQKQLVYMRSYLEPLLPLANSHMVDYFTKSTYKYLPNDLRCEIETTGYATTLDIILSEDQSLNMPYLNEYLSNTQSLCLSNLKEFCLDFNEFKLKLEMWNCQDVESLKLKTFVTQKKSHEVNVLSNLVVAINYLNNTTHLVDIGDGKGYLSSFLALYYNIPVLGIDASVANTDGALKRVKMLEKDWKRKGLGNHDNSTSLFYKQVTKYITEDTDFDELIRNTFLTNNSQLGLIGLHTCGNLGATCVKIFNKSLNTKTLCNVPCCYHLLTEEFESNKSEEETYGFPLSSCLRALKFKLGRNTRMLSSQSVDRIIYRKELQSTSIFYRSIFEVFLKEHSHCIKKKEVGRLRGTFSTFEEYAQRALQNIEADLNVGDEELKEFFKKYQNDEIQFKTFYLLRCMLAPVIESIILLDRLLFLVENGHHHSFLVKLFDPVISPRCYAVVSFKN